MEEIHRIYKLLLDGKGLKIRDISNSLKLDKYHIADILYSTDNIPYWYQDGEGLWVAKEGAIEIEEVKEDKFNKQPKRISGFNLEQYVYSEPNLGLRGYIKKVLSYPEYSYKETIELFERYRDGDEKALDLIVKGHLKLVIGIASFYKHKGLSFEDLIQEGNVGLMNAIEQYDYTQPTSFRKFAKSGIYRELFMSTLILPYTLTYPPSAIFRHNKYQQYLNKQEQKYELELLDSDELESLLGTTSVLYPLSKLYKLPYDLKNQTINSNYDEFTAEDYYSPDWNLIQDSMKFYVTRLVCALPDRERDILIGLYGLKGCQPKTLEEIGELYGLTRERVRQIRERAIRKLRYFLFKEKDEEFENKASLKFIQNRWQKLQMSQFDNFLSAHPVGEPQKIELNPPKGTPKLKEKVYHESKYRDVVSLNPYNSHELTYNKEDLIPNKTRVCLLQILANNQDPMSLQEIYTEVNNKYFNWSLRIESVEHALTKMREVRCMLDGRFRLMGRVQNRPLANIDNIPTDVIINRPTEVINKPTECKLKTEKYTLSTPLRVLVEDKILTNKMLKHCAEKGLYTIGDVNAMIQKHHLTPDSTRFTKYTIEMWFKIVDLLYPNAKKDPKLDNKPQQSKIDENKDKFIKYSNMILNLRQAKIKGEVIVAKPVLLLAIIEGIEEGVIIDNKIILNEWLEKRYESLMKRYTVHSQFDGFSPISNPFWHLQSDGFWHLVYSGKFDKNETPSISWLKEHVYFVLLDNSLWELLVDGTWRNKIRELIVINKLNINTNTKYERSQLRQGDVNTYNLTLNAFLSGSTPEEIAKERGLVLGTIYGHFAKFVESGKISAYDLVSKDEVELVKSAWKKASSDLLSEIKMNLPPEVSYETIKVVMAHLKREEELKKI